MAQHFVIHAMPEYLKCIVADNEFLKFLQNPDQNDVAKLLVGQLLPENEKRYPSEAKHNS